jgi:MarR family transcriptional regulator, 2-MHQ and catechol-resistance regulon repressor
VTYLVDRLERRGLVRRDECAEDRRARYAVLTPDGEEFVRRLFPAHAVEVRKAVAGLTREEQRAATGLLKRLGLAAVEGGPGDA